MEGWRPLRGLRLCCAQCRRLRTALHMAWWRPLRGLILCHALRRRQHLRSSHPRFPLLHLPPGRPPPSCSCGAIALTASRGPPPGRGSACPMAPTWSARSAPWLSGAGWATRQPWRGRRLRRAWRRRRRAGGRRWPRGRLRACAAAGPALRVPPPAARAPRLRRRRRGRPRSGRTPFCCWRARPRRHPFGDRSPPWVCSARRGCPAPLHLRLALRRRRSGMGAPMPHSAPASMRPCCATTRVTASAAARWCGGAWRGGCGRRSCLHLCAAQPRC